MSTLRRQRRSQVIDTDTGVVFKPTRSQDLRATTLPDGFVVLLSEKTGWAHSLTPLAALVWEFCDGQNTVDEIAAQINAIPEVISRPVSPEEIQELLNQFSEDGFLDD